MSSPGQHRATATMSPRVPGGARRRPRRRPRLLSPLLVGVLSLGAAGAGGVLTSDSGIQPSVAAPAVPTAAAVAAAAPSAPAAVADGEAQLTIDAAPPPSAAPSGSQTGRAESPDQGLAPAGPTPRGSVAAPDPTPLTSDTSPLAAQLREQSHAVAAPESAGLASAVLPPMLPDAAAQQAAFAAEQARIAALVEQRVAELKAEEAARAAEEARRASEWVMPLERYRLSARFGQPGKLWSSGRHTGIDLSAPSGTPLVAMQDAVVVSAGYAGAYGKRTVLRLADGTELWYAHQSRIDVEPGQMVRKGDQIGAVGATGNVTGPHLHLEVRPKDGDEPVDPLPVMAEHGLKP